MAAHGNQVAQLAEKHFHLVNFLLCPFNFNFAVLESNELLDNLIDDLFAVIFTISENHGRFADPCKLSVENIN